MSKSNKEWQQDAYARKSAAWNTIKALAIHYGYAVKNHKRAGYDEFLHALQSGEARIFLLTDDDYPVAHDELHRLATLTDDVQTADILKQLAQLISDDFVIELK